MFCIHCGKKLPDDNGKFCPACGAPIESDPVPMSEADYDAETQVLNPGAPELRGQAASDNTWQYNNQTAEDNAWQYDNQPDTGYGGDDGSYYASSEMPGDGEGPEQKKSKLPFVIGGAIALVVIALIAVVAFAASSGIFKRAFASPESYYQYVEQKNLEDAIADFTDGYGNVIDSVKDADGQQASAEITLRLEEGGRALAGFVAPVDLSWLEKVTLKGDMAADDGVAANLEILLNEDSLATLQYILEDDTIYMRIPELSESYLRMDMAEVMSEYGVTANTQMYDAVYDMYEEMPDADALEKVLNRYTAMMISHVTTVEKSKGRLVFGDISQSCTRLDVSITAQDAVDMLSEMIPELQKDKELEEIIRDLSNVVQAVPEASYYMDDMDIYGEFLSELDELSEEMEYVREYIEEGDISDEALEMTLWVDGNDRIIGRTIGFDAETLIEYYMPMDGDDFNYYLAVPSEEIVVSGSGTKTSSVMSGDFDLLLYGEEIFSLGVKDFAYADMKDQKWSGTFTFKPSEALLEEADMDIGINTFALRMSCEANGQKSSSVVVTLMNGQSELISLEANAEATSKADVPSPDSTGQTYSMTNEEELMKYLAEANWDGLLDGIRNSDLPEEYVSYAEMYISQMQEMFSYYY